ncbi:MAG: EutN/CcmL family microcompartment protein [Gemmatimonadota bacterium]
MKLARVIGRIVLSRQVESYREQPLHITQDLNEDLEPVGEPEVSATWQAMEEGDLVIVEVAREACNAFEPPVPVDAVIIGRVDSVHIERAER